jgi:ribosomal protein L32
MLFLFTLPLWLVPIILFLQWAFRQANPATTIHRQITAPDGKVMTFMVPPDEPAAVTIARMHAHERKCPECAEYILREARVCRYCGCRDLPTMPALPEIAPVLEPAVVPPKPPMKWNYRKEIAIWTIVLAIILLLCRLG